MKFIHKQNLKWLLYLYNFLHLCGSYSLHVFWKRVSIPNVNVNPPFLTYLRGVRIPFFIAEHFVSEAPYFVERFSGSVLWSFFPTALLSFWGENIWMSVSDSKLHTSFPWKGTKKNKQNPNTHTDRFRHSVAHLKGIAVTSTNLTSNIPAGNLKSTSFFLLKRCCFNKTCKAF